MPIKIVPIKSKKKKKTGMGESKVPSNKNMGLDSMQPKKRPKKAKGGGMLKSVPKENKGLGKLPEKVRNNMGYMKTGGKVMKMRGGGMAERGLNFRIR